MLMAVYLSMLFIWNLLNLPKGDELISIIKEYFNKYGILVVFISALIEGFLFIGQYFPGGTIVFLGVISTGNDIHRALGVVLTVSLAFFIAYTLNFLVGKYGWHKLLVKLGFRQSIENAKQKLIKQGLNAVIFSYWEPNIASITATAAGILQFPFKKFELFSVIGILIWNTFWGVLVFLLGAAALKLVGLKYILIIFSAWIVIILFKAYFLRKKDQVQSKF